MARKSKGVVKRAIVTPDKHFPLADMSAIGYLKQTIEIVKPDIYIDLGDVGEWHGASHWQWKRKKRPPLEYQLPFIDQDIAEVNAGMDWIDESLDKVNCKTKHMIEGNHDDWMNKFVDEHPFLKGYRFKECVKLKRKRLQVSSCGQISQDWETTFLPWPSFRGNSSHTKSSNAFRCKCNVRTSPRFTASVSNAHGWGEVSMEYWMPQRHERRTK